MTAARAFLEDILRNPDDDTPRLIFADWLEDQGDSESIARSELIRIQCKLAQSGNSIAERAGLQARQDVLLQQHGARWAGAVHRLARKWAFHRGFVDTIEIGAFRFLKWVERLFQLAPIQHLRLFWSPEHRIAARLAECSFLGRLVSLDLSQIGLDSPPLQALLVSEHLTRLQQMHLYGNRIGGGGVRALLQAPVFAQLTHLDLRHNHLEGASARLLGHALEELAERGEMVMQCLDLRENSISWLARRSLNSSPLLRKVVRLD
jgi:uncharacterized protein (TIGR02996 family)